MASWSGSVSPHSGGTVPDSHRVPLPSVVLWPRPYHRGVAARNIATAWLPVVVWAAVIFALSSIPSLNSGLGTWDLVLRKLAHVVEFAVLAVLLVRATTRAVPSAALGVAYAVTDEIHQHFVPGRTGSPVDLVFDAAGVVLGVALATRFARLQS